MTERTRELAHEFLARHGFALDDDGVFFGAPHVLLLDYYEGCAVQRSESAWENLANSASPILALEGELPRMRDAYVSQLADSLESYLRDKGSQTEFSVVHDYLTGCLRVSALAEDWLDAPVRLNLGLTIDEWTDYTLNVTYPAYNSDEYDEENKGKFDKSSIMWLTRRQGYKQVDLRRAQYAVIEASELDDPLQLIPSPFLYSAAMEIWHELCDINQLGFFIMVPLRELLVMWTMQHWGKKKRKWPGYVLLSKDTRCGFFTTWLGSRSLLGIKLERDVKVPLCDVDIRPDGMRGYSVYGISMSGAIWRPNRILHWGLPRQFRRDAQAFEAGQSIGLLP